MFHPYSLDLRERAVALLDEGATSVEVAELLDVSDSWVRKMRLRRAALGHLIPGSPPGKERLLSEEQEQQLCLLVLEQPDATLEDCVDCPGHMVGDRRQDEADHDGAADGPCEAAPHPERRP